MDESYSPSSRPKSSTWAAWVILALVVAAIGTMLLARRGVSPEQSVGKTLPALRLVPLDAGEQTVTLDELAGRVALVNFWATWCPPCREELPHLADLGREFGEREDFVLAAVSCGEDDPESLRKNTEDLLVNMRLTLPVYTDPDSLTRDAFAQLAGPTGFPTSFVLDRQGVIRRVWVGYGPGLEDEMRATVKQLLDE